MQKHCGVEFCNLCGNCQRKKVNKEKVKESKEKVKKVKKKYKKAESSPWQFLEGAVEISCGRNGKTFPNPSAADGEGHGQFVPLLMDTDLEAEVKVSQISCRFGEMTLCLLA